MSINPNHLYSFESELPPNDGYENFVPVEVFYTMEDIGVTMIPSEDIQPVIQSVVSPVYGELVADLSDDDIINLEKEARKDQDMVAALAESARFGGESV